MGRYTNKLCCCAVTRLAMRVQRERCRASKIGKMVNMSGYICLSNRASEILKAPHCSHIVPWLLVGHPRIQPS